MSKESNFWFPLLLLTLAGFTFNTSELIPIGLLSDIAGSFGVSEARAGLLITVYAWVVALMSLPLMLLFARVEYRRLMTGVVTLFFVSHIATVLSTGYYSLMASRIGVALAHSLFWSIAPAMAVAITPPQKRATALSTLVAGGGIALIAGLPLGRVLGLVAGWRMAFAVLGGLSGLIIIGLLTIFPTLPQADGDVSRRQMLRSLVTCRPLIVIYIITAVIVTGHYTGYSYIEPFMIQIIGMTEEAVTLTLSLFGVAGLLGSYIMSRYYYRHSGHPDTHGLHRISDRDGPASSCRPHITDIAWCAVHSLGPVHDHLQHSLPERDSRTLPDRFGCADELLLRHLQPRHRSGSVCRRHSLRPFANGLHRLYRGAITLAASIYCIVRYMPMRKVPDRP